MKVAIDISQIAYGTGVSTYTRQLVLNLSQMMGDDLQLLAGTWQQKNEIEVFAKRTKSHKLITYPMPPKLAHVFWNTFHLVSIDKLIKDTQLLHTSDWTEPPSKKLKVTTVHDLNFMVDPEFAHPYIKQVQQKRLFWVKKETSKIIAVSQATKRDLGKYLGIEPERVEVIYEGPTIQNMPEYSQEEVENLYKKFSLTKPFFLVPGAGHPRKNLKRIVSAFEKFRNDYQLVIIGRDNSAQSAGVVMAGFVTNREYELLVALANLVLYPSLYEGFGIPILDAFVCGVPVVTSNTSSMPEIAGDGAICVDPTEVDSIVTGVESALNDRNSLIEKGYNQVTKFSWQRAAKETLELYRKTLENGNRN
jgi:glycosyltransferase involved in cell wall biosynthesis